MAIQVTGYFKNPATQMIIDSPVLLVQFHGMPKGKLTVDINVMVLNTQGELEQMGAFPFEVTVEEINNTTKTTSNPYDAILHGIQEKLIQYLPMSNATNSTITLNII